MNVPQNQLVDPPPVLPEHIGRYRVDGIVGQGGFGIVYRACDEQLQRLVAIKVPHRKLVAKSSDAESYLTEARTLAKLQHPNIVPVYDVGASDDFPCFIVSQFIEGGTLEQRIAAGNTAYGQTAELIATVAEALRYAHRAGFTHRDVKPGNILLDQSGQPFVVDFGLALKEENVGRGPKYAGTPLYMSPEQARGEGHRVDGRSDIFSLGVVLYEMLTGRRPFKSESFDELVAEITTFEPPPPRQYDDAIPKELERICFKAMSKRAVDRYSTAKDFADDLRTFLNDPGTQALVNMEKERGSSPASAKPQAAQSPTPTPSSESGPIKIVPKGLRSFDANDADFFLELVPGKRTRDGLPESIAFWKTRIEEADPQRTFAVGRIYGPSGCGKSSLVKAGLLPCLADRVLAVHVDATAAETESRLLIGLRRKCLALPARVGLKETLAALRRGQGAPAGKKVLIVIDQFEQWLHAKREEQNTELAQALRHCDGGRVQAIIMVRGDFATAANRFMHELEIPLLERENYAEVDLLPMTHAEKVLSAIGRYFGALPDGAVKKLSPEAQALRELAGRLERHAEPGRVLRDEIRNLVRVADFDLGGALVRSRKVLQYVVQDVFARRINPPGTQPLESLLQRLVKDRHLPDHLGVHANTVKGLGNVGAHDFAAQVAEADVRQALTALLPILQWYVEKERPDALAAQPELAESLAITGTDAGPAQSEDAGMGIQFVQQAIRELAQEGQVICVRLALFAQMMENNKPWTPALLKKLGGAEGIGVEFLEQTFRADTAKEKHREHREAAQAVLQQLLPEAGAEIKGHMRAHQELLQASGYGKRPKDFDELLGILDTELRLITPTDPSGDPFSRDAHDSFSRDAESSERSAAGLEPTTESTNLPLGSSPTALRSEDSASRLTGPSRYYQLTHDYLVPSLREWLTRKQKETRRGRAELALADRAVVWNARPENRQLPSLWQWLQIKWLTAKKNWSPPQRKMMRKATRYHAVRGAALAVLLAVMAVTGLVIRDQVAAQQKAHQAAQLAIREQAEEQQKATHAAGLVQAVLNADTPQVPAIIGAMAEYRQWADPLLREEYDKAAVNSRQKLHASLALLSVDPSQRDYLYERLLNAEPNQVAILREALLSHQDDLVERLWLVAEQPAKGEELQRLRAASALASYDPDDPRWEKIRGRVADDLVAVPAVYLSDWMNALRPVRQQLQAPLTVVFRDVKRRETERYLATDILANYAADKPEQLADLLVDADDKQFAVLLPILTKHGEPAIVLLQAEMDKQPPADAASDVKDNLAKRQANAAVALLRLDRPAKVWPVLKYSPDPLVKQSTDPRGRSFLIHRFGPLGADVKTLIDQLAAEKEVSIQRALILSIGEMKDKVLGSAERTLLIDKLKTVYEKADDPGLHAAAEWTLGELEEDNWLRATNEKWTADKDGRALRLARIEKDLASRRGSTPDVVPLNSARWYVTGQKAKDGNQTVGHTMVVILGPVVFEMGSPLTEARRRDYEILHKKKIGRTFAIAAKPVTWNQYVRFDEAYIDDLEKPYSPSLECPVNFISWTMAAKYCNWLSNQEGIWPGQWCYEIDKSGNVKLREGYLHKRGYRLPTETEWEYACRAGAITSRYYGESEELLANYARYLQTSDDHSWPVGKRKPNDFGLFDMHGNVWNWCLDRYATYPTNANGVAADDKEDGILTIDTSESRVLRGGSFFGLPSNVRSAFRDYGRAAVRGTYLGFRPARTLTAE